MSRALQENPASTKSGRRVKSGTELQTLVDLFHLVDHEHKRSNILNYKRSGSWIAMSSQEMLDRIHAIAAGLHAIGVHHGDRVAILSDSRVEWTLVDGGCIFAGAIDVPIYPTLMSPQVSYILNDCGASILVVENETRLSQIQSALEASTEVKNVILIESSVSVPVGVMTLAQLESLGATTLTKQPELSKSFGAETTAGDLATIIYTSGTTGEPKGVMLSHSNLITNLIDSSGHLSFGPQDCALSVLPLSHVFERQAMYMYLYRGMSVYFAESLSTIGANMREVSPTVLVGVPRIFEKIFARTRERASEAGRVSENILAWAVTVAREYAKKTVFHQHISMALKLKREVAMRLVFSKWHKGFGGRLRLFISGGAALPEDLGYVFLGAGFPIIQGYGLTETSPVISTVSLDDNRIGTVGKPIPNVEVRIAIDGEIEVRGPNVMQGYYKKPVETRAVFTEDGWFRTGDIGSIDNEGFIRITDRKKELFKTSGGKYIAPQPIEEAIKGSRFVNQVVLVGNGRKFPAALIVPNWEQLESYAKLKNISVGSHKEMRGHPRIVDLYKRQIDRLTPNLARYEKVKAIALLENELTIEGGELTPTLKVKRRVIDEKYRAVINDLYQAAEANGPTQKSDSQRF